MQNGSKTTLTQMVAGQERRRKLLTLVCLLSVVVVASVFWWLSQPAATMSAAPVCGVEAHQHSEACYTSELICTETDPAHEHTDACYAPILTCGLPEHEHTDVCYVGDPTASGDENAEKTAGSAGDVQDVETPAASDGETTGSEEGTGVAGTDASASSGAVDADAPTGTDSSVGESFDASTDATTDTTVANTQPQAKVEGETGETDAVMVASGNPETVSTPAALSDTTTLPSDVEPIAIEGSSTSDYKINISLKFIPVDENGAERTDLVPPETVRVKLDYDSSFGNTIQALCSTEIQNAIAEDRIVSDLLCVEGEDKTEFIKIRVQPKKSTNGSTYLYGIKDGGNATAVTTPNAYFVVRYIPGNVTLSLADTSGAAIDGAVATCIRGAQATIPAVDGYTLGAQIGDQYFAGWYEAGSDTVYRPGDALTLLADTTLVPYLTDEAPATCAVTFNYQASDATATTTTVDVLVGSALGSAAGLPDPACEGYRFDGWFDAQEGGNQVDLATTVAQGEPVALFAHYTKLVKVTFSATNDQLPYINIQQWPVEYYIVPGTSLSANGYSTPAVTVDNAGAEAGAGKASVYSWATADGLVCNADTVFDADTTLDLQLFDGSAYYQLSFVCGCSGNHQVYGGSPAFSLGQRIDQSFIDAATAAGAGWTSEFCTEYGDGSYTVTGWYLKNKLGEMVELTPGVAITADYLDDDHGNAVQVYAQFTKTSEIVTPAPDPTYYTVTFELILHDDESGADVSENYGIYTVAHGMSLATAVSMEDGATLAELPTISQKGYFCDWVATNGAGEQITAALDTVVTEDLEFLATFVPQVTVHFTYLDYSQTAEDGTAPTVELATVPVRTGQPLSATIDTLPQAPVLEGHAFDGWFYKTSEAEGTGEAAVQLTLDTVLTGSDVSVTGVYHEIVGFTVTVHDIGPDDNEMLPEGVTSIDVLVPQGEKVADYLDGLMLAGNTNAADVKVWYTKDAENNKLAFDPATAELTGDVDIYTYTYRVVLTVPAENASTDEATVATSDASDEKNDTTSAASQINPVTLFAPSVALASEAEGGASTSTDEVAYGVTFKENSDGTVTITINLREGETLKASDLIDPATGADYSLYAWKVTAGDGTEQTVQLVGQTFDANYSATGTFSLPSNVEMAQHTITFYVFVNDNRYAVETRTVDTYRIQNGRFFITPAVLESVYGPYGFSTAGLTANSPVEGANSTYQFAHEYATISSKFWTTNDTLTLNGSIMVPILNSQSNCAVYYLPHNVTAYNGGQSFTADWIASSHVSFYSVDVVDESGHVYQGNVPDRVLALYGQPAMVTVSNEPSSALDGYDVTIVWNAYDAQGNLVDAASGVYESYVDDDAQTTTLSFASVTAPYTAKPSISGDYALIEYDINLDVEPNVFSTRPTVDGKETLTEPMTEGYVVRTPSPQHYYVRNADFAKRYDIYEFAGWAVDGDVSNIIEAGTVLAADQLRSMNLIAQWTLKTSGDQTSIVNFYIALSCSTQSMSSTIDVPEQNFTDSVFAAIATDGRGNEIVSKQTTRENNILIYGDNAVSNPGVDQDLRSLAVDGLTGLDGTYYLLDSFPSDEYVLAQIRESQKVYIEQYLAYCAANGYVTPTYYTETLERKLVFVGSSYVPWDEITSDNFTVRWNVFKDVDDGYHIDGLLVAKQGRLTITKTFYGNDDAVTLVKANYALEVVKEDGSLLMLNLREASSENANGYISWDEASDTYTWVVSVDRNATCTVRESGYQAPEKSDAYGADITMATLAEYCLLNSDAQGAGSWMTYDANGVSVTIEAYPTDVEYTGYQTVALLNSYIPTNAMVIRKVDATTGLALGQPVDFVMFKANESADDEPCVLWEDASTGVYYMYDPVNQGEVDADDVVRHDDGAITVGSTGSVVLVGLKDARLAGTYELREVAAPHGYMLLASPVVFTVDENGVLSLQEHRNATLVGDGLTLRITNDAETTAVVVRKEWAAGETPETVVLQLYRNGASMGEAYRAVLDGAVDETYETTAPWQCEWPDLPLYVNGVAAAYSVVETWIGSAAFDRDADAVDGYANYVVTYDDAVYRFADGTTSDSPSKVDGEGAIVMAQSAILSVHNRRDRGAIEFQKTDETGVALVGATFKLLKADGQTVLSTKVSGADGMVSFPAVPSGTYYLIREANAPAGYVNDDTMYKVVIVGSKPSIYAPQLNEDGTEKTDDEGNVLYSTAPVTFIENRPSSATVTVKKVDEQGQPLSGAMFGISKDGASYALPSTGNTWFEVVGESAVFALTNLPEGSYALTETVAPAGYYSLAGSIEFVVDQGEVLVDESTLPTGVSYDATVRTFTVANHAGSELPQTGGPGTLPLAIGGLLLMAAPLLYVLTRRLRGKGVMR